MSDLEQTKAARPKIIDAEFRVLSGPQLPAEPTPREPIIKNWDNLLRLVVYLIVGLVLKTIVRHWIH